MIYLILILCVILILFLILIKREPFEDTSTATSTSNTTNTATINPSTSTVSNNILDINKIDPNNDVVFSNLEIFNNNIELFFKTYYTIIDIDEFNNILKNDFDISETFGSIFAKYIWSRHNLLNLNDILYLSYSNLDKDILQLKYLGDIIRINQIDNMNLLLNEDYKTTGEMYIYYGSLNNKKDGEEEFDTYLLNINSDKDIIPFCYNNSEDINFKSIRCKSKIEVIQNEFLDRSLRSSLLHKKNKLETYTIMTNIINKFKSNNELIINIYKYYIQIILIKFSKIKDYNTYMNYNSYNYFSKYFRNEVNLGNNYKKIYTKNDLDYLNGLINDLTKLEENNKYIELINELKKLNQQFIDIIDPLEINHIIDILINENTTLKNIVMQISSS